MKFALQIQFSSLVVICIAAGLFVVTALYLFWRRPPDRTRKASRSTKHASVPTQEGIERNLGQ